MNYNKLKVFLNFRKVILTFMTLIIFLILIAFHKTQAQDHFPVPNKERIREISEMLPNKPQGIGYPITERYFWDELSSTRQADRVIHKAIELLDAESLPVNKEQWMAYVEGKTERQNYEQPFWEQEKRFCTLVLAEALENKGRFIKAIEGMLQDMLSLGTWKKPQSSGLVDADYWYGKKHFVDLAIAQRSFNVATADFWLQNKLDPVIREKLRNYIKKNTFDPYFKMLNTPGEEWWWMLAGQNWNAVCHAGVVGSALTLIEDPMERAAMVAGAEIGMNFFMKGFGDDGFCNEGIGYWSYGFGHFLVLNEIVRINTKNSIDWLDNSLAARAALFPSNVEILNGVYPAFSDGRVYSRPPGWMMDFSKERLGVVKNMIPFWRIEKLDDLRDLYYHGMLQIKDFPDYELSSSPYDSEYDSEIRNFFPDGGLLICRPYKRASQGMAISIKGGHNSENHNHNDLGTFEVVLGDEKFIIDPGGEVYGKQTFGNDRYKSEMMNSFGHSVPVVAEQLQSTGRDAKAIILEKNFSLVKDYIKFDLASAYDVGTLLNLTRSFYFERGETSELTIIDEVEFTQSEKFEIALILDTYNRAIQNRLSCTWEMIGENQWRIHKGDKTIEVDIFSPGNKIKMIEIPLKAHRMPEGYNPIRLGFEIDEKVKSAQIIMKITPVTN
jgi:hypothetical protein